MSQLYVDRMFLNFNGVEVQDLTDVDLSISDGTKVVQTMSRNRRNKGTVKGNRDIKLRFSLAVQNTLASPKIEDIDFQSGLYSIGLEHGGDRYLLKDVDYADSNQTASGVGTEGKKQFNLVAMDIVDQKGDSALFQLA